MKLIIALEYNHTERGWQPASKPVAIIGIEDGCFDCTNGMRFDSKTGESYTHPGYRISQYELHDLCRLFGVFGPDTLRQSLADTGYCPCCGRKWGKGCNACQCGATKSLSNGEVVGHPHCGDQ